MKAIDVQDTSQSTSTMIRDESIDPGETDVPDLPASSSSERQLIYQSIKNLHYVMRVWWKDNEGLSPAEPGR